MQLPSIAFSVERNHSCVFFLLILKANCVCGFLAATLHRTYFFLIPLMCVKSAYLYPCGSKIPLCFFWRNLNVTKLNVIYRALPSLFSFHSMMESWCSPQVCKYVSLCERNIITIFLLSCN